MDSDQEENEEVQEIEEQYDPRRRTSNRQPSAPIVEEPGEPGIIFNTKQI